MYSLYFPRENFESVLEVQMTVINYHNLDTINFGGDFPGNPIIHAVKSGKVSYVNVLVSAGADLGVYFGYPLRYAASRGSIEISRALLQAGANPNLTGFFEGGRTPLEIALNHQDREMSSLLMEFGPDPPRRQFFVGNRELELYKELSLQIKSRVKEYSTSQDAKVQNQNL